MSDPFTAFSAQYAPLVAASYEQMLKNILKPDPLLERMLDESNRRHDEWWAAQTRWFKIRRKSSIWLSDKWYSARQAVADRIFPEGRDYE